MSGEAREGVIAVAVARRIVVTERILHFSLYIDVRRELDGGTTGTPNLGENPMFPDMFPKPLKTALGVSSEGRSI